VSSSCSVLCAEVSVVWISLVLQIKKDIKIYHDRFLPCTSSLDVYNYFQACMSPEEFTKGNFRGYE
jgi:hypothetical protein